MAFEKYQKIIDELSNWLYKVRFYSWGEPLMHKDIYKMIAYATDKNIGTEISTNLNVFKESDAKSLIESGLEVLIVSLDGADEKVYSHYRVGGDFSRVINNIRAIVKEKKKTGVKNPFIEIQFLVMRHNELQIPNMKLLAKELGVDRLRFGPVTVNMRNEEDLDWLPEDEKLSRYSYSEKKDQIYSVRKKCEWLWRSTVINWDGTVSPCCVYEGDKSVFGSLADSKFEKLWNNESYRQSRSVFTKHQKGNNGLKTICSHCRGIPRATKEKQHGLY
ncbi:Fe-S oxidoreductase [Candidatus Scalindua japonica]|uniref:Fe-S oxidoreductase n=2 Tax=Candidatus Scalindua japonica TaxID=1284222 RepID=A0A286TTH2_9BACT|nr:Fe-S oxidoreductase [Candidatus Scalindua japonica]